MALMSIRDFAETQHISYEAVRKQVIRFKQDLRGHIVVSDRKQLLDEYAVDFLASHRKENPITVVQAEDLERLKELEQETADLKDQLIAAQKGWAEAQQKLTGVLEKYNSLLSTSANTLETKQRYEMLLEDHSKLQEELSSAQNELESTRAAMKDTSERLSETQANLETARNNLETTQVALRKAEKGREEAETEARSYHKTIFGLYRKTI